MSDSYEESNERFNECVKDLDPTLHVGGFPPRAIVVEPIDGQFVIYKEDLRPDKAINLLKSLAKNAEFPWLRIHSVNQKTKTRVDTAHNEGRKQSA